MIFSEELKKYIRPDIATRTMPDDHEVEISDLESGLDHEDTAGEEHDHDSDMMAEDNKNLADSSKNLLDIKKPKPDPKDPLRPRRKKARRACFACQRAHLTCGKFHCPWSILTSPPLRQFMIATFWNSCSLSGQIRMIYW